MNKFNVEVLTEAKVVDIIYFVREHDTIYSISNKFNIDAKQIIEDNNLSTEEIAEGDILWIRKRNSFSYVVKPLDTLEKIATLYGVTVEHIKKLNNTENLFIGQKIYI